MSDEDYSPTELLLIETIQELRQAEGNGPFTWHLAKLIDDSGKPLQLLTIKDFIDLIHRANRQ